MTTKKIRQQAQTQWGCTSFPFSQTQQNWESPRQKKHLHKLENWLNLRSSGILHGAHGTGKTHFLHQLIKTLNPKEYHPLVHTHSTLRGPGLLRSLTQNLGGQATSRREDNLEQIHQKLVGLHPRWPILILEEAQNYSSESLEEIRLLSCRKSQNHFSLLLVGDHHLLARLQLGINQALLSRLSFQIQTKPLSAEESAAYLEHQLASSMIHQNPFDENAQHTLIQVANGNPRLLNQLARNSLQKACEEQSTTVTLAHVQESIEELPWLPRLQKHQ